MNKGELARKLQDEGFRSDGYELDGGTPSYDGLVLRQQGDRWVIEYFERGITRVLGEFSDEHEACEEFYRLMCRDGASREDPSLDAPTC